MKEWIAVCDKPRW
ncbi:BnaC01g42680D [Brassica napus]|uniref:BnaC01g42680D protein n=1 Tax=Brassica napus TaxID=3708 RepID=A0A078JSY3_BRANA|nr:BnaC01g42680D [Brassica napus]